MTKQVVTVLTLALSWNLLTFAQTTEEEMRQEKLMFRQHQAVQHSQTGFNEEQKQLRRELRVFTTNQRHADKSVMEAEEVKQLKRDYRSFRVEQNRQRGVAAENIRKR